MQHMPRPSGAKGCAMPGSSPVASRQGSEAAGSAWHDGAANEVRTKPLLEAPKREG